MTATTPTTAANLSDDVLLKTEQAATLLQIPASTLGKWRSTGENNIPYIKIGHHVRYRTSDLRAYIDGKTRTAPERKPQA